MEEKEIEKFENYQIACQNNLDISILAEKIKNNDDAKANEIFKKYSHSLFSPLLYYIIQYMNNWDEKNIDKICVGKSEISNIKVLYAVLNRKIYELYFKKTIGPVYDENININIDYKIPNEEENYSILLYEEINQINEKEINLDTLKKMAMKILDEDNSPLDEQMIKNLPALFEYKLNEIKSTFKYGYALQERLISMLTRNTNKTLKELPNIIFYQKNTKRKAFNEFDRIYLAEEDISFTNVKIYTKIINDKINKIEKGEILKMEKDSLNFIEIKTSIVSLSKELEKENKKDIKDNKSKSSKSSKSSKRKKVLGKILDFIELFSQLKIKYTNINLIFIIDSFFNKSFFDITNNYAQYYLSNKLELERFNIYFVQIESHTIFLDELNAYDKLNKAYDKLTNEHEKLINDHEKLEKYINKIENDKRLKKIKKKINEKIKDNNMIKELIEGIEKNNNGKKGIIGEYYSKGSNTLVKYDKIKEYYNTIIDLKTFIRYDSEQDYTDLLEIINMKHLKHLKQYQNLNINSELLILLVDELFIKVFLKNSTNIFLNKNIIIKTAFDSFYLLEIKEKDLNSVQYSFGLKIPGFTENIDIDKCKNFSNFLKYSIELNKIDPFYNLNNFILYDPYTDGYKYFISSFINNVNNNNISVIPYNDLSDNIYRIINDKSKDYKYLLLIYCNTTISEKEIKSISNYFFKYDNMEINDLKEKDYSVELKSENIKILAVDNNQRIIYNFAKKKLLYSYSVDENKNILLNKEQILNLYILEYYKRISKNNDKSKILIEECFSIIALYLAENFKTSEIYVLEKNNEDKIIEFLYKNNKNKINKIKGKNIIEFFAENNEKFDIIISENNIIYEKNDLNEEKMTKIKAHLKKDGRFYFKIIFNNKYITDSVISKIMLHFKIRDIVEYIPLEYFIECSFGDE